MQIIYLLFFKMLRISGSSIDTFRCFNICGLLRPDLINTKRFELHSSKLNDSVMFLVFNFT